MVDGVDDLFKTVGDDLVEGALTFGEVHHFIGTEVIVFAIFLLQEVAHIHQEFHCGTSTAEHRAYDEHHVDETAAERLQIGGCRRVAPDGFCAVEQPGIHGDGSTIVCQRSFIVFVDEVIVEQVEITLRSFLAVHFFEAVAEQTAVQTNEIAFGKFTNERSQVLVLYIGIRVELRARGCIRSVAVIHQKTELLQGLAVFGVLVAIDNEGFGSGKETFSHECHFHLVLDFLNAHVFCEEESVEQSVHLCGAESSGCGFCRFDDGIFDFIERESLRLSVALLNELGERLHCD